LNVLGEAYEREITFRKRANEQLSLAFLPRQFAAHTQGARANTNGASERTQRKLDALARKAPELLERVRRGELSAHAAAKAVVREPTPLEFLQRAWKKASRATTQNARALYIRGRGALINLAQRSQSQKDFTMK
jgi:hypothetical protein